MNSIITPGLRSMLKVLYLLLELFSDCSLSEMYQFIINSKHKLHALASSSFDKNIKLDLYKNVRGQFLLRHMPKIY